MKLRYIIIGELRGRERSCLRQNLLADKAMEKGVSVIGMAGASEALNQFPAEESIFISGNAKELQQAIAYGMAALGYLRPEKNTSDEPQNNKVKYEVEETASYPRADMWAEGFEEIDLEFLVRVYERHHGLPWTILTTKRCVVKEFSMEYLDDLFELYAGEGMTDYIEPLYQVEQEREYQEAYIANMYGFYGYGMWIVCDKNTGKLIGRAGLEHREEFGGELELGYAIGVPYQRQGYAAEVCRAIMKYADSELGQTKLNCLIEEGNDVSERFAEYLGFQMEQILMLDGKQMKKYVRVL